MDISHFRNGDIVSLDGRPAEVSGVVPAGFLCTSSRLGQSRITNQTAVSHYKDLPASEENLLKAGFEKIAERTLSDGSTVTEFRFTAGKEGDDELLLLFSSHGLFRKMTVMNGDEEAYHSRHHNGGFGEAFSLREVQHLMRITGHDGHLNLF